MTGKEALTVLFGLVVTAAITVAIAVGLFLLYVIFWGAAYPIIGNYCKTSAVVSESKLDGEFWGGSDKYRTTFEDGTSAYTTYVKIGEDYCMHEAARFPW